MVGRGIRVLHRRGLDGGPGRVVQGWGIGDPGTRFGARSAIASLFFWGLPGVGVASGWVFFAPSLWGTIWSRLVHAEARG